MNQMCYRITIEMLLNFSSIQGRLRAERRMSRAKNQSLDMKMKNGRRSWSQQ